MYKKFIENISNSISSSVANNYNEKLQSTITNLKNKIVDYEKFVPPGHFYSPMPDLEYIKENEDQIFSNQISTIPGIDMNDDSQKELLLKISEFYSEIDFEDEDSGKYRYYYNNDQFTYGDAITLYSMIRNFKPSKIIEIGSGYSSALTLDVNQKFFDSKINLTFIEPYPERLKRLTKNDNIELIEKKVQEVPLETFNNLKENDILFVDSSHVSKCFSDVNYILFHVLPNLPKGVIVHFHDIFCNFEYPKAWVFEGRGWNENYILRSFLQFNSDFKVMFFNDYIYRKEANFVKEKMPLVSRNNGGSIWLKRV